jgi:hypothetical protein
MGTVKLGRPGVGGCVSADKHKEIQSIRMGDPGDFPSVEGSIRPVEAGQFIERNAVRALRRLKER